MAWWITEPDRLLLVGAGTAVAALFAAIDARLLGLCLRAERFALRSLLDAEESDLRPRLEVTRGGERATGALVEAEEHAESWPWVAGLLLVLLLAEVAWACVAENQPTRLSWIYIRFSGGPSLTTLPIALITASPKVPAPDCSRLRR